MKKLLLIFCVVFSRQVLAQQERIIVPNGHSTGILSMVMDDQRRYFYAADKEKVVMWEAATGYQLYSFPVSETHMWGMGISHRGDKIAYLTGTKLLCYSTLTGKKLWEQEYIDNWEVTMNFTADDSRILIPNSKGVAWYDSTNGKHDYLSGFVGIEPASKLYVVNNGQDLLLFNGDSWYVRDAGTGVLKSKTNLVSKAERVWYLPQSRMFVSVIELSPQSCSVVFQRESDGVVVKRLVNPTRWSDMVIIPSINGTQLLISKQYNKEHHWGIKYELYNTNDFLLKSTFTVSGSQTEFNISQGFLLGDKMLGYFAAYKDMACINLADGAPIKGFAKQVDALGKHQFNSVTGRLDIISDKYSLRGFNLETLRPEFYLPTKDDFISYWAISNNGKSYLNLDSEHSTVLSTATNKPLYPNLGIKKISSLDDIVFFGADDKALYYSGVPGRDDGGRGLYKMNFATRANQLLVKLEDKPWLSDDNSILLSTAKTGVTFNAEVRELTGNKVIAKIAVGKKPVNMLAISEDKKTLQVVIEEDELLNTYSLPDGKLTATLKNFIPSWGIGSTGRSSRKMNHDVSVLAVSTEKGDVNMYNTQTGKANYTIHAHDNGITGIYFSANDKIMYTISDDDTMKIWWAETGKLLGTVFMFKDSNDYVFVDEFGRFDGSPGGIKKLYYLKNRTVIPLDLVYEKYYTPNMFNRMLNGEVFPLLPTGDINPIPKVRISYAEVARNLNVVEDKVQAYNNTTGVAEITVNASAENDKVDEIRLFHNGKIVNLATRGLFVTDNSTGTDTKKYTLNLLPGVNNIRAVALNSQRTESQPDEVIVNYKAAGQPNIPVPANNGANGIIVQVDKSATMHLVVVGINAYKNPKMSLNYALADATAFKDEAEKDAHTIITNVKTYFVTDEKADKNGIVAAFTDVQKSAKPQDVFVFYYAGHGVISEKHKEFYLVPNDVTDLKNVDEALAQNGIPSKMLQQYAIDIAAQKQVFILDACQSAGAFAQLMTNDANQQKSLAVVARSTGTHWIAASGSQQFAQEFAQLGHGAFTYVLLKAMKGEAAANKMITVNGLKSFLQVQVPDLMKKYNGAPQYPATYGYGSDFPVQVTQ
nr:caspase family protein [uncultured Mucilaginibacter sp.]